MSSGELDMMIVGFVLWLFATGSYNSAANDIAEEDGEGGRQGRRD